MPPMPLRASPQEAADAWEAGLGRSPEKIKRGIDRVTVSPGERAAAQADVWASNVAQAKEKFRRNSRAVDLGSWQSAAKAGADAVGAAASRKKGKYTDKVTPVFQHMAGVLARVDSMPRGSYEQNKARAIAMMDGMHSYVSPGG